MGGSWPGKEGVRGRRSPPQNTQSLWQGAEGRLSAKLEGSVLGAQSWVRTSGLGVPTAALKSKLRKAIWGKVGAPSLKLIKIR